MARCTVCYRDGGGMEHAVEVTADSLYEAAALGFEALSRAELTDSRPGPATLLEVTVHPPAVIHRVRVQQIKDWLNGTTSSPKMRLLKQKLQERIGE